MRDSIDLTGCVDVAGLLHVIHNCGRGLESALMCFSDASYRLSKLANLLRKPESKERLEETCFNDPVGQCLFAKGLKAFSSHCHPDRWGTVADTILAMNRDTYCALNHGWNLDRYVDGGNVPKDDDNDTDEALQCPWSSSIIPSRTLSGRVTGGCSDELQR